MPCFKSDIHHVVKAFKLNNKQDLLIINLLLSDNSLFAFNLDNTYLSDLDKYAKKNIDIPSKENIVDVSDTNIDIIDKMTVSHPITIKEKPILESSDESDDGDVENPLEIKEEKEGFEQISIFDDLDE
jgi:hypothetical protein